MLKIYITRHGETVWNVEKRLQGWKDSELTEKGIQNAVSLGEVLKEITFDLVYASPSQRTVHTANLIKGDRDIQLITDEKLREIHMGDWEGRKQEEVAEAEPEAFHAFWNTPHLYFPEKGESFFDLQKRAKEVINQITATHQTGNILIVTHMVVIKILLAYFKGLPLENLWEPPYIHDTSLSVIELGDETKILLEGSVSHRTVTTF